MKEGITVLSLCDGMSCGQIALDRCGITVKNYFASEIKNIAIKVTQHNYPQTIHIGDICKVRYEDGVLYTEKEEYVVGHIDLLMGGSPCQDFSLINVEGKGLEGTKSKLFFEYLRVLREVNPTYFLLENVRMKKESESQLNTYLGVKGIHINSNRVSIQNRPRIYWTDIPHITIPTDKGLSFQDVKDTDVDYCKQFKVNNTPSRVKMWNNGDGRNSGLTCCANVTYADKVYCLTRKQDRCPNSGLVAFEDFCRYLTRRELEIAQTVPIGYTNCVSYNQAQDLLGDGWTVDVIVHILENMEYK